MWQQEGNPKLFKLTLALSLLYWMERSWFWSKVTYFLFQGPGVGHNDFNLLYFMIRMLPFKHEIKARGTIERHQMFSVICTLTSALSLKAWWGGHFFDSFLHFCCWPPSPFSDWHNLATELLNVFSDILPCPQYFFLTLHISSLSYSVLTLYVNL